MNRKTVSFHDSDIEIRSADGFIFQLHRVVLGVATGAFPGSELDTGGEMVQLNEPANVLSILFAFLYPKAPPDLHGEGFEVVAAVAEAVGKYEVFSAVLACNQRLAYVVSDPLHIFQSTTSDIIGNSCLSMHPKFLFMQSSMIILGYSVPPSLTLLELLLSRFWKNYLRLMWFHGYVFKIKLAKGFRDSFLTRLCITRHGRHFLKKQTDMSRTSDVALLVAAIHHKTPTIPYAIPVWIPSTY